MQLNNNCIIRDNAISNTMQSQDPDIIGLNGDGITVGSAYRSYTPWAPNPTWPGDWIKNTVVEKNTITNSVNAYIRLQRQQGETILRGNTLTGGTAQTNGVLYDPDAAQAIDGDDGGTTPPPLPPPIDPTNCVVNPGFELGLGSWTATDGFDSNIAWTGTVFALSTADKNTGSDSLKCTGNGNWQGFAQIVTVKPNTDYTFSFYSNIISKLNPGSCQIKIINATGTYLISTQADQTVTPALMGQWHLNTFTFNSGSSLTARIWIQDGGFTGYFDDFQIIPTNAISVSFGNYIVNNQVITNMKPQTSMTQFTKSISPSGVSCQFFDVNNKQLTDAKYIGTGTKIDITLNSKTTQSTVFVYGDVNGDGSITLNDLITMRDSLLGTQTIDDLFKPAGDLYGEGKITLNSLVGMLAYISGTGTIQQNH